MKKIAAILVLVYLFEGCKEKERTGEGTDPSKFFPVLSYIKSQVAHVDTSLYSIIKVITTDSISDTTHIPREEFRKEAEEFLTIPDLMEKKSGRYYREEKMYDETLGRVLLTYIPEKENLELLRQEVVIVPTFGNEDKVRSIIIEKKKDFRDSSVLKRMLWQVDESFQVVSIIEGKDASRIITKEIIWYRPQSVDTFPVTRDSTSRSSK